jgi:hypothetical protein
MGGLFILVVVLMPQGLAGLWVSYAKPWLRGAQQRLRERPPQLHEDKTAPAKT